MVCWSWIRDIWLDINNTANQLPLLCMRSDEQSLLLLKYINLCMGKKLPSLKLYPSREDQWSIQGIVIKFLVIILTKKKMQTTLNNSSDNSRFPKPDISKCHLFKTLHSLVFPYPLQSPVNSVHFVWSLFFFFFPSLSVILRNSSGLKTLRSY